MTEKCAWCGEPAEDAIGLGWALCFECGEIHGATEPSRCGWCDKIPAPYKNNEGYVCEDHVDDSGRMNSALLGGYFKVESK